MNLQTGVCGFRAKALEVRFLEIFKRIQIGNEEGVGFERGRIFDQGRRLPTERAHRKIIEAELDLRTAFGQRGGENGGRGCGQCRRFEERSPGQILISHISPVVG